MFGTALEEAFKFTRPVVVSRKTVAGECSASIGAFIVINQAGWIITAGHILEQIFALDREVTQVQKLISDRDTIQADNSRGQGDKRRALAQLPKANPKASDRYSAFWTWPGVTLKDAQFIPGVDIGIGRLEPFDPQWIEAYPSFKDPNTEYRVGTSVCRLGYPFHQFKSSYDSASGNFVLPPEALPIPIFASEGIIARMMNVKVASLSGPPPFPMKWFETSSPGLKGQSGGPVFDSRGTVWGVQSNTYHYPLGFSPTVKHGGKDHTEHHFLNVGRAVHAETIFGLLTQANVNFSVSTY